MRSDAPGTTATERNPADRSVWSTRFARRLAAVSLVVVAAIALALPASARTGSPHGSPVKIEAQLSQGLIPESGPAELYLRVGIRGQRASDDDNRAPLNVALVLDKSGSMNGSRIREARRAAKMVVDRLRDGDTLTVIAYDTEAMVLIPAGQVGSRQRLKRKIDRMEANGSTAIYAGMRLAASELDDHLSDARVTRVILLSDGRANVGPRNPQAFAKLGRNLSNRGMIVSTIGLGNGYNEDLMAALAQAGEGNHAFVSEPLDIIDFFDREFNDASRVVAQDLEVTVTLYDRARVGRSLGRKGDISDRSIRYTFGQLISGSEQVLLATLLLPDDVRSGRQRIASITVTYRSTETGVRMRTETHVNVRASDDQEMRRDSFDADVMADVTLLEARERRARAIKLRDSGRSDEARALFGELAKEMEQRQKRYGFAKSKRFEAEQRANAVAAKARSESSWRIQRKQLKALDSNAASSAKRY